jgi:hypothetical protein
MEPFAPLNPAAQPQPLQKASPCDCSSSDKKPKKKRKKQNDRTVCYRGTFVEKPRGLSKTRRERVDCKTGKPILPPAAANEEF